MRALPLSLAFVVLAACGGTPDMTPPNRDPDGGTTARLELGTGTASFVTLAEDDPMELVHGPQGGWHLEVTTRMWVVSPDAIVLSYVARNADGAMLGETRVAILPTRVVREGDHYLRAGDILVLDIGAPEIVVGQDLTITATLLDGEGELASDMRRIRVVDER